MRSLLEEKDALLAVKDKLLEEKVRADIYIYVYIWRGPCSTTHNGVHHRLCLFCFLCCVGLVVFSCVDLVVFCLVFGCLILRCLVLACRVTPCLCYLVILSRLSVSRRLPQASLFERRFFGYDVSL